MKKTLILSVLFVFTLAISAPAFAMDQEPVKTEKCEKKKECDKKASCDKQKECDKKAACDKKKECDKNSAEKKLVAIKKKRRDKSILHAHIKKGCSQSNLFY